jgi:hypothetical protein
MQLSARGWRFIAPDGDIFVWSKAAKALSTAANTFADNALTGA